MNDTDIHKQATYGLCVGTLGAQPITYVTLAVKAVADALKAQRVAMNNRALMCPEAN